MNVPLLILLVGVLVISGVYDLRYRRIPNFLTFPTMLLAILLHSLDGGLAGAQKGVSGLALGMATLLPIYLLHGMGAGDVKLMGAVGATLGPMRTFYAFLFTGIIGGVYALILLAIHKRESILFAKRFILMGKTILLTGQFVYIPPDAEQRRLKLCYGVAIAVGTMSFLLWEHLGHPSWSQLAIALTNRFL